MKETEGKLLENLPWPASLAALREMQNGKILKKTIGDNFQMSFNNRCEHRVRTAEDEC